MLSKLKNGALVSLISLASCAPSEKELAADIAQTREKIQRGVNPKNSCRFSECKTHFKQQIDSMDLIEHRAEVAKRTTYYVNVELRQDHTTLSLKQMAKDELNATLFSLPVSRKLYKTMSKGTELVDNFRSASMLLSGTVGSTKMSVTDVPEISPEADTSSYRVTLEVKQSHFSINPMKHIKDEMNAFEFNWDIPGNVYNNVEEGHDFIEDGFRTGSFVMSGSVGDWHLKLVKKMGPTPPSP